MNKWLQIKPRSQIPEIALVFLPSHCGLSGESYSIGFFLFYRSNHKVIRSYQPPSARISLYQPEAKGAASNHVRGTSVLGCHAARK